MNLEEAIRKAKKESKEDRITLHVNRRKNRSYYVSDWYDCDSTVATYSNGDKI
jgi:hypothetical protein